MKSFLLVMALITSSMAFAAPEQCTFEHIKLLRKAKGPKSKEVREILTQEGAHFSCEVDSPRLIFPQVCGRFVFAQYNFNIHVGAARITAVVREGRTSCTQEQKKTELLDVIIKR